jgi:hypothetical protein
MRKANSLDGSTPIKMRKRGGYSSGRVVHWNESSMVSGERFEYFIYMADQSREPG